MSFTSFMPTGANILSAIAYLYGLAAEEFDAADLMTSDPKYPLVVMARIDRTEATRVVGR